MQIKNTKTYIACLVLLSIFFYILPCDKLRADETSTSTQIIENNFPIDYIFGKAMWYGKAFHGRKMANGKKFDMNNPTLVASRTLKLGTKIKIVNLANGITIDAIVSDRGPYSKDKKTKQYIAVIDVSYAAAKLLEFDKTGIADVKIKVY